MDCAVIENKKGGWVYDIKPVRSLLHMILYNTDSEVDMRCLIGGSTRFDYHSYHPRDFDLFIHSNDNGRCFYNFVREWGLIIYDGSYYNSSNKNDIHAKISIGKHVFDMHYISSMEEYNRMCAEHTFVDDVLSENDDRVRKIMKGMPFRGVNKFKAIVDTIA